MAQVDVETHLVKNPLNHVEAMEVLTTPQWDSGTKS